MKRKSVNPTQPGWYWFKGTPYGDKRTVVIEVRVGDGKRTELWGYCGFDHGCRLECFHGKWDGPFTVSEEVYSWEVQP